MQLKNLFVNVCLITVLFSQNFIGCRKEVQEEFGKMTYKKLRLIWDKNLDQVYKHYTNFFDHEIRASIAFPHGSKKEFEQARFLPKLGEDENHHFFDDYDGISQSILFNSHFKC